MRPRRGLDTPAASLSRRGLERAGIALVGIVALAGSVACSPRAVVTTVATTAVSTATGAVSTVAGAASSVAGAAASVASQASSALASGSATAGAGLSGPAAIGPLASAPANAGPPVGSSTRGLPTSELARSGTSEAIRQRESRNRTARPQVVANTTEALESCLRSMFDMRGVMALLGAAGFDVRETGGETGAEAEAQDDGVSVNLSTPLGLCLVSGNDLGFEVTKALTERTLAKLTGARIELASIGVSCGSTTVPSPGGIVQIDIVPTELNAGCSPDTAVQILVTAGEAFL